MSRERTPPDAGIEGCEACDVDANEWAVCTGRPGCVQKGGVEPGVDTPATSGADIVRRLRGTWIWSNGRDERLRNEAADEIARLRAEVERLTGERDEAKAHHVQWVAEVDADLTEIEANMDRQDAERAAHIAALAQRVAEAVRGACAERGHSLWYDAESECGPSYTSDGIRALDLGPIVAAALAKDGE
jgi:hypothetical protein